MSIRLLACFLSVAILSVGLGAQERLRLTRETLAGLKSSSNDPAGDFFAGTPARLNALVDAFVADTSMVSRCTSSWRRTRRSG